MVFKAQLFALTGVQPERQKIMLKGAILGDATWDKVIIKYKDGNTDFFLIFLIFYLKLIAAHITSVTDVIYNCQSKC